MIDSPALRAIQEVQERGSWLQTQESIAEALSRSELQDSLVDTVPSLMFSEIKDTLTDSPLHFSLAEQSAIDNALQATRPLQTLSEAMEQILEGTKRLGVSDLSEIGAESGIAAKQTFEDISLSTTVDQFLRATPLCTLNLKPEMPKYRRYHILLSKVPNGLRQTAHSGIFNRPLLYQKG